MCILCKDNEAVKINIANIIFLHYNGKDKYSVIKGRTVGVTMNMIEAKNLVFEYIRRDEEGNVESIHRAVDEVSLDVKKVTLLLFLDIMDLVNPQSQNILMQYYYRPKVL